MVKKEIIKKYCHMAINNIMIEGITDVDLFNKPFEIDMLKDDKFETEICSIVVKAILSGKISELKLHKLGHVLIPKKTLSDYRKCALTEIYDELVYLTLVLIIAGDIEKIRIKKSSNRIFSYRYLPQKNGRIFDPQFNYTSFREEVARKSCMSKNKVMVECDLSNFYDRLNIHRVESILRSDEKIDIDIISLINEVLLFWANRDSYGLPIGSNASRILAEASLVEVDNYLISKKIDFCRFVDDYRIFAKDAYTAHSHLAILVHCLNREGICLNIQKTKIKDISDKTEIKKSIVENKDSEEERKKTKEWDDVQENRNRIIRGYSGLIPTKFRELSNKQIEKLCENNLEEMFENMKKAVIVEPEEITDLIKTIIAQEKYYDLAKMPVVLKKFPQFIPYYVDVMLKKGDNLDERDRKSIKKDFMEWFDENTPEYIQVYLVRLFASDVFSDKNTLLFLFRNLRRNSGDYIGSFLYNSKCRVQ
ncbi:MAG: RNA-directed DNA polymerase [Clostridium sp.]|nr:RNA-directed DNA polymerase [Clostridium sp.]